MPNYLNELNAVQRGAVTTTDGPVLVIAGPGSGKTRVLTYRIAYLIEQGVAPWEILSLTFTNKAAREMKERITHVVGERANRVWAGTFHSVFGKILRVEAEKLGYISNFTIYDTEDSKSLISSIIKEMSLDTTNYNAQSVLSRISMAKSNIIPPKLYEQNKELMAQDHAQKRPMLHKIYETYVNRCKRAGAMDFDDLLYQLFVLFYKNPDNVLEKYRQKFRYILVDEFQDTNYLQYRILKQLVHYEGSPRNICVVGDDAQSIYAFRGATIENILDFEHDFKDLKVFKLEQNYRSTHHIVQAANEVINNNRRQIQKKIWTDHVGGNRIKLIRTMTDNEEGKHVADLILEQKNRFHLRNSDIAILYRTNYQSRVFEENLRYYNLPYRVFGGMSFYQRKEVKDLLAYLRLAVNPYDEEALRRVINYPRRGIGDSTLEKISETAARLEAPLWECLEAAPVPARIKNALTDFAALITRFSEQARQLNAYDLAMLVFRQSGMHAELAGDKSVEGMGRFDNANALLDGIKEFVENDLVDSENPDADKSLSTYLQSVTLYTDADPLVGQADQEDDREFVSLMSVHAAKGLEFKSVFVVGMEENLFPSIRSMEKQEDIDEERRLFYVAITRAKQLLTLSYSNSRYRFGQMKHCDPSRFIQELPAECIDNTVSGTLRQSQAAGRTAAEGQPPRASISGNFKKAVAPPPVVDPATFKPSPANQIAPGMRVLHLRFGEGKVLSIDGASDSKVATIHFEGIDDDAEKRIMLKFAKLQIL